MSELLGRDLEELATVYIMLKSPVYNMPYSKIAVLYLTILILDCYYEWRQFFVKKFSNFYFAISMSFLFALG